MRISVITPSFNQAQFLPINLTSVNKQTYHFVEHVVVDPGSTDGSTALARKDPSAILIAEPDRGQSDGICKGFSRSTGDLLAWLNSDDFYPDDHVLESVVRCFQENPEIDIVYGDVNFVDEQGVFLRKGFVNKNADQLLGSFQYQVGIVQPGVFWRRRVFQEIGGPSEEFEYCMDYELWVRMASKGYKWHYLPKVLAHHRWWGGMKTSSRRDLSLREHFKVCDRYFGYVHWKWLDRYADYLCSKQDGVVNHASDINPYLKRDAIRKAIDEVVTQEILLKLWRSDAEEMRETKEYIERWHPHKRRIYFTQTELQITAETSEDPKAQQRVAWNIFDATSTVGGHYVAYHVPDNFDRYFDAKWHAEQLDRATLALARLSKERRSDICVVVGNGPSLRNSNLSLLAGVDTIISNFAGLSKDLSQHAKILTVVNDLVAKQGAVDFNSTDFIKVVPFWLGNYFNVSEKTYFVNATVRPEFGLNMVQDASWRSTVSFFNLQLAYALGYRKVLLIGFDHSYVQPKDAVEGVVINQVEDDLNHFDPRYFKGKDWQAADTANMENMYNIAKAVYERDAREIVNCTAGGKLELFRRGDLRVELGLLPATYKKKGNELYPPKLLMIDSTPVGHDSATGQIKKTFLGDWPSSKFLQVWETSGRSSALRLRKLGQQIASSMNSTLSLESVVENCRQFDPDVIYFRPVDSDLLFDAACRIIQELNKPLVIHMMDDWPERLRRSEPVRFARMDKVLRSLLNISARRLSIGSAMAKAYEQRYGCKWLPLANGVDVAETPAKDWFARPPLTQSSPFVIRYMGALAEDMTYDSIRDIADVVASLTESHPVRFEIFTMDWCRDKAEIDIGKLSGVSIHPLVDEKAYRRTLAEADCLVIAYNFDPRSITYIGLSLANKMPECLATGVPLLAYGPIEVATIRYLKEAGCAQVVSSRDPSQLSKAISALITERSLCEQLGRGGRDHAAAHLTKLSVQAMFRQYLSEASAIEKGKDIKVVGPFAREEKAHYDETDSIAELFKTALTGELMIDVGAHHGWAHAPFLDRGWQIFAFEPDHNNRAKLLERLAKHKNKHLVLLDTRCVSNRSQKGVSFFNSEQSTGISGLSAFHESHVESQKVDTITLTEFFHDKPLPAVDFLKIDTEGHDLFVLQGYPWERGMPAVIECEFEDNKTVPLGYTFHDLANFLADKGYTVYVSEWHPIIRYGIRHDWRALIRYPCELADSKGWGNLLAFREPIDDQALVAAVKKVLKVGAGHTAKPAKKQVSSPVAANMVLPSLACKPAFRFEPGLHFVQTSPNQWSYSDADAKQKLWIAVLDQPVSAGQEQVGGLRIQADRSMTVNVSLGRHGRTDYEGATQRIRLTPGVAQSVKLGKAFGKTHAALKLQVEVLELPGGGSAFLKVEDLYITASPSALQLRQPDVPFTLREANRLLRVGELAKALQMYLHLYEQQPMQMYANNAFYAAKKLGLGQFNSIEKLREIVLGQ